VNSLIAAFLGGPWEIIIILALLLLFFGSSRLPKMARSLGSSLTEFKKGLRGEAGEDKEKEKLPAGDDPDAAPKQNLEASKQETTES